MNNTFNLSRFGKVLAKDIRNLIPTYGRVLLGVALLPLAFWLSNLITEPLEMTCAENRQYELISVVAIVLAITPSFVYANCNRAKKGIHFAMLPASKLEKYLSMIVVSLVMAPVAVMLIITLVDLLLTLLPFGPYKTWLWETCSMAYYDSGIDYTYFRDEGESLPFFAPCFLIASAVSTGGLYMFTNTLFQKNKVINTILWCLLLGFVLTMLFFGVISNFGDNIAERVKAWAENFTKEQILARVYWISTVAQLLVGIGFYIWGGFRLKKMRY